MEKKILLSDIADLLSDKANITKKSADNFVRLFFSTIEENLLADRYVKIKNFGSFKLVNVSERESVNVATGERFQISSHSKVTFTAEGMLRDQVNLPFAHFTSMEVGDEVDINVLEAAAPAVAAPQAETAEPAQPETAQPTGTEPAQPASEPAAPAAEVSTTTEEIAASTEEVASSEVTADTQAESAVQTAADEAAESKEQIATEQTATPPSPLPNCDDSTEQKGDIELHDDEEDEIPVGHDWWKTALILLATLGLMTISYLAGYYRVFDGIISSAPKAESSEVSTTDSIAQPSKPVATPPDTATTSAPAAPAPIEAEKPVPAPEKIETTTPAKTAPAATEKPAPAAAIKPAPTVTTKPAPTADPKPAAEKAPQPKTTTATAAAATTATPATPETKLPQLPGGDYNIVGTRTVHVFQTGESLYGVARKYYGNPKMIDYIVFYNHIKDPNIVAPNAKIAIPELVRKQ